MSDLQGVRATPYSLQTRIQSAVLALVLLMYLVALLVLGLPLRERAQQQLDAGATHELGTIMAAIQDHALQRDYPAIQQAIAARTAGSPLLSMRFTSPPVGFEARTPPSSSRYPAWFATLPDIRAPQTQSELVVGGHHRWHRGGCAGCRADHPGAMGADGAFILLMICSLLASLLLLSALLLLSLRGLYSLRTAVRAIESDDFGARASLAYGSPPRCVKPSWRSIIWPIMSII